MTVAHRHINRQNRQKAIVDTISKIKKIIFGQLRSRCSAKEWQDSLELFPTEEGS